VTTPGGVANLPVAALTLDTMAAKLQDMSTAAMKARAVERFPTIMDSSTGLSPASDITPFGILTTIFYGVNSLVANADPADITGPEDLPPLLVEFIEGLPVVGQFVEILEAILGTYDGEDETLLAIQTIFAPIRAIVAAITAAAGGLPLVGAFFDIPASLIHALFGGSSILPQVQPAAVGGVSPGASLLDDLGSFLTNVFNGITGNGAASATQDETATAIVSQTDTVSGTASTLAQFLAAFGPGNPDSDDFERTSSVDRGPNWRTMFSSGTGPLATPNGHDSHYGGGTNTEFVSLKTDIQAASDHQTVAIIFAGAIPASPFFTPVPFGGSNDVWLRCTNFTTYATREGLRFRVNSVAYTANWTLSWFSAGAETVLASGSMSVPTTGSNIALEAGVGGNSRRFVATLNGTPISGADFTDSGLVTSLGPSNLYRGDGGQNYGGQGSADLQLWTAQG
jgi:hypothetical protein